MIAWRREPFRSFFPLGLALGVVGTLPWLLFATGLRHAWPGLGHAMVMTQSFLVAMAVGFLGTMLPRRAQCGPLSTLELGIIALGLVTVPVAAELDTLWVGQLAYLVVLGTLGQYVVRALLAARRRAPRPTPPSFVLLPLGVILGASGAILLMLADLQLAGHWAFLLGKQLAQQGLMLGLLLALVPMLAPVLAQGNAAPDPTPAARRRQRALYLLAGLALAASFPLETAVSIRAGLLLRGAICLVLLVAGGRLWQPGTRSGIHRWLFRFALWAVPLGLVFGGIAPDRRIPLAHVTYLGGLSLVTLAISAHVAMLHTSAARMADRSPWLLVLAGGFTVIAAVARLAVETSGNGIFTLLAVASAAWLAASLAWAAFLAPRMLDQGKSS